MKIFLDRQAAYLKCLLKSRELHRKYLETGNEFLKILSEAWADSAENYMGHSKLFSKRKNNKANI